MDPRSTPLRLQASQIPRMINDHSYLDYCGVCGKLANVICSGKADLTLCCSRREDILFTPGQPTPNPYNSHRATCRVCGIVSNAICASRVYEPDCQMQGLGYTLELPNSHVNVQVCRPNYNDSQQAFIAPIHRGPMSINQSTHSALSFNAPPHYMPIPMIQSLNYSGQTIPARGHKKSTPMSQFPNDAGQSSSSQAQYMPAPLTQLRKLCKQAFSAPTLYIPIPIVQNHEYPEETALSPLDRKTAYTLIVQDQSTEYSEEPSILPMPKTLRPAFGELGYPKAPFTASAPNRPAHSRLPRIAEAPKLSEQASISPIPNTPRLAFEEPEYSEESSVPSALRPLPPLICSTPSNANPSKGGISISISETAKRTKGCFRSDSAPPHYTPNEYVLPRRTSDLIYTSEYRAFSGLGQASPSLGSSTGSASRSSSESRTVGESERLEMPSIWLENNMFFHLGDEEQDW